MEQEQQTTEVRDNVTRDGNARVQQQTVTRTAQPGTRTTLARVIWYVAGVIIALLLIRIVLLLLGANQASGFVDFVYALSGVFAAPFYGIFPQPTYGVSQLDSASIVAVVVYALVAWGIVKLVTIDRSPREV